MFYTVVFIVLGRYKDKLWDRDGQRRIPNTRENRWDDENNKEGITGYFLREIY